MKRSLLILLMVCALTRPAVSSAADPSLVSALHRSPPAPCISKAPEDRSPGFRTHPDGITREDLIGVQAWGASLLVDADRELLSPQTAKTIDTSYTAVFYEKEPLNEVGIYAFRFIDPIRPDEFRARPGFNGRLFVRNGKLLILLWHKDKSRTAGCFSALEKALEASR